ncbi:alpha/beta hydrolase [Streptomyces tricolor]|nr:alpha/beta hydrolase [Streptomyces tricolor]
MAKALLHPFFRTTFHPRVPWPVQRVLLNAFSVGQPMPAGARVDRLWLGARRAERVTAGPASGPGAVLYLHGGGFTVGSPATHRSLAAHLARATGRPVYVLDYRLAPPSTRAPRPWRTRSRRWTSSRGTRATRRPPWCSPATRRAAGSPWPPPGTRSPWRVRAPAKALPAGRGAGRAGARLAVGRPGPGRRAAPGPRGQPGVGARVRRRVPGAMDPADPRYAPARGDLTGLPPTYLHTNTRELLYGQCVDLAASLRRAGVTVRFAESRVLWHAAQAQAGLVREAAASVRDIGSFLREQWDRRPDRDTAAVRAG